MSKNRSDANPIVPRYHIALYMMVCAHVLGRGCFTLATIMIFLAGGLPLSWVACALEGPAWNIVCEKLDPYCMEWDHNMHMKYTNKGDYVKEKAWLKYIAIG